MDAAVGEAHEDRFPPSVSLIEGSARRIREARRALYGLQAGIDGIIQGMHSLDASAVPATGTRSSESESQLHDASVSSMDTNIARQDNQAYYSTANLNSE